MVEDPLAWAGAGFGELAELAGDELLQLPLLAGAALDAALLPAFRRLAADGDPALFGWLVGAPSELFSVLPDDDLVDYLRRVGQGTGALAKLVGLALDSSA